MRAPATTATASPLDPVDAAWLRLDTPDNPMVITAVLWFDEPVDWRKLEDVVVGRLLERYPKFRQRIVTLNGDAAWEEDPAFALDDHLAPVTLAAPGDREALRALVGELMSTPLDLSRSPWQLHLVDGYEGGSAVLARLHHCLADGMALASVLLSMTDDQRDSTPPGPAPGPHPTAGPVGTRLAPAARLAAQLVAGARAVVRAVLHSPRTVVRPALLAVRCLVSLVRLLALPADPGCVFRGPLGTRKGAAWSRPLPLADVKRVARATGGTVNDVLLAATAGGLRRYALSLGAPATDIRTAVPVNLRDLDQPVPPELGNRFGLVFVDLPLGTEALDERVALVHRATRTAKLGPQAVAVFALLWVVGQLPPVVERLAARLLGRRSSAVTTNVPGPQEPVYLAGTEVSGIVFWVPQTGPVALGVSIFSYAGTVTVGFAGDAGVVPDPQALAGHLEDELAALAAGLPD